MFQSVEMLALHSVAMYYTPQTLKFVADTVIFLFTIGLQPEAIPPRQRTRDRITLYALQISQTLAFQLRHHTPRVLFHMAPEKQACWTKRGLKLASQIQCLAALRKSKKAKAQA